MKDFLGQELQIGDECVIIEPNYRNFLKAKIIRFTPENVRLEYQRSGRPTTILQAPHQVVKL